jgi:hypothetical protein
MAPPGCVKTPKAVFVAQEQKCRARLATLFT